MSPEIRINGELIASVPDETGMHQTIAGKPLYVNVDGIDADNTRHKIIVAAREIGGRREICLTCEGIGNSSKHSGDKKSPEIDVALLDRPIRVTYKPMYEYSNDKRVRRLNPRWIRNHGGR